jgi:hypothetical protein
MNIIYLVQSTPDYQGQFTHFASLEFEKAEAAAIKILQTQDENYLKIIAVPLDKINATSSEIPKWKVMGVYRTWTESNAKVLAVKIASGIWKTTPREPEPMTNEPPKCERCNRQSALPLHRCPYKSDMHDDETLCTCCEDCKKECSDDR